MRHFIPSPSDKYEFLRQKSLDPRLVSPCLPFVRDPKFPVDAPDPALRFARPIRLCLTRLACTASLVFITSRSHPSLVTRHPPCRPAPQRPRPPSAAPSVLRRPAPLPSSDGAPGRPAWRCFGPNAPNGRRRILRFRGSDVLPMG